MRSTITLTLALLAACGKSGEEQAREDNAREAARAEAKAKEEADRIAAEAAARPATPPPGTTAPAAPAAPEPTTPAELERARNQAMIDGRDKDVLRYCELGKLDAKSNPQALLGCALAACRLHDEGVARGYARPLPKALLDQARKVCLANQIGL